MLKDLAGIKIKNVTPFAHIFFNVYYKKLSMSIQMASMFLKGFCGKDFDVFKGLVHFVHLRLLNLCHHLLLSQYNKQNKISCVHFLYAYVRQQSKANHDNALYKVNK